MNRVDYRRVHHRAVILPAACLLVLMFPGQSAPASNRTTHPPAQDDRPARPAGRAAGSMEPPPTDWMLNAAEESVEGQVEALTTEHYRFYIPEHAIVEARPSVTALESLWSFYEKTIGNLVPLPTQGSKITVFYFPRTRELTRFRDLLADPPDGEEPGLMWKVSTGWVAFDASAVLGPSDLGVLFRAVTHVGHQILLYEPGVRGSWWVREGLAVYFMQTLVDREGQFLSGPIRTSRGYIRDVTRTGRLSSDLSFAEEPRKALKAARKDYRRKRHVPIRELLEQEANQDWPDDTARDRASVEAWVLIHFLLHGESEGLRPRPAGFLALERRGEGGVEAFRRTVAFELDRFESFVYKHVERMR